MSDSKKSKKNLSKSSDKSTSKQKEAGVNIGSPNSKHHAHTTLFIIIFVAILTVAGFSAYTYFSSSNDIANDTAAEEQYFEELLRNGETDDALALLLSKESEADTTEEKISYNRSVARVYTYSGDSDAALENLFKAEELAENDEQRFVVNRSIVEIYYDKEDWQGAYEYTKKIVDYLNTLSVEELGEGAYERSLYVEELIWLEGLINE